MRPVQFLLALGLLTASLCWAEDAADPRIAELQTAGYYELSDRARELGLDTSGTADDLRRRVAAAWKVELPATLPDAEGQTLTIDAAREAGLVTVDAPGEGKLLRLSGGLQVTLLDRAKKVTHQVAADELWYDQAHEEMTARGHVVYTMTRESSSEVFRGESLTFRLSDSQGVFYGGASDRSRTVGTKTMTFRYSGGAIRRSSADLVVLDSGTITSSLGTEPNYRIQATKIWVLAPGEWGLQDAVLYLGRVPVLYFPFFFQPGDEFFFNPVLSFPDSGDRRGTSLQTTTYFWGKKTKDSSPFSFLQLADGGAQDGSRVRKGLFLVRGEVPADEAKVPANWVLKAQADFYSNLGFLTGVEVSAPGAWKLNTLSGFFGLGVTRTVSSTGTVFTANPFQSALDPWNQSDWNGSWAGDLRLPFRWGGRFSMDAGWGSLSLESYSDPYLAADLTASRSENFSIFQLFGLSGTKTAAAAATVKSSLQWTASANPNPLSASASLLWDSKSLPAGSLGPTNDPENLFYYPSQLTLPQATLNLSGTLWPTVTLASTAPAAKVPAAAGVSKAGPGEPALLAPEAAVTPAPAESPEGTATSPNSGEPDLLPPDRMEGGVTSAAAAAVWTNAVTWSLRPTAKTDTRFNTAVVRPSAAGWDPLTSRWSASYDGKISLTSGWSDGTWSLGESLSAHQQAQDVWYESSAVSASTSAANDLTDRQQTSSLVSQALSASFKPFASGGLWRESSLQYSLSSKLWEQTYLKTVSADFTKNTVTAHSAQALAAVYLLDGQPSLKASASGQTTLEPLDPVRTYTGGLDFALTGLTATSRVTASQTTADLVWGTWDTRADWNPVTGVNFSSSFQYDLQAARPVTSTSLLTAWGASVQYRQQRTTPYQFNTATRQWTVAGAVDFLPQELRFGYALDLPAYRWWLNRQSLSSKINLGWPINLQKYSDMPLTASYTLTYSAAKFLDLQITGGFQNKTAFRYVPALVDTFGAGAVAWVNPIADLWDSVSVWDQAALRRTGYKMTTLSVGLVHYLDDWQIKVDYSGSPQLNTAGTQYNWNGTLTLLVSWYPIPELKTQMTVDKDGLLTIAKNTGS